MNTQVAVSVTGAEIFYGAGKSRLHAVRSTSIDVLEGEAFGIVGGSGSGKSTLLRVLAGLGSNWEGRISIAGMDLIPGKPPGREFHRRVQMVFQDPYASLNPRHTVDRIISDGLQLHRFDNLEGRVLSVLEQVGLGASFRFRYPHELSGGQRQRVAIARAIVLEPRVLLLDEPTSALDASVQAEVLNLLNSLRRKFSFTCVFVSHDLSVVGYFCDRVAVMHRGQVVEQLTAQDLAAESAAHPYTRELVSASAGSLD